MAKGFLYGNGGSGGAGLNFRVLGGTSAPANPKENDIWVNTDTEISNWIFSSVIPTPNEITATINHNAVYLDSNGVVTDNNNFNLTDYTKLPTDAKSIIVKHCSDASSGVYHGFYDANKNKISLVQRGVGDTSYEIPENAVYVRLSLRTTATAADLPTFIVYTARDEGMLWISVGTSSSAAFNALKKNGVMVYPISARQYVGGEWLSVTAKSYQDSAWVDWVTYYYKEGNTYDDVTGGYTLDDATAEADNIKMYITGDGAVAYATTNNKVDISGISTLYLKFNIKVVSSYSRTATVYLKVSDSKLTSVDGSVGSGAEYYDEYAQDTDVEDTISLDVSSVTGEKYIFVGLKNSGKYQNTTMNIKEIRGE